MKYFVVTAFTIAIFSGCKAPPALPAVDTQAALTTEAVDHTPDYWYSPFVVELSSSDMVFSSISFKDVGTGLDDNEREPMMETLAESMALALEEDAAFQAHWNLRYDAELSTAEGHLSCGQNHLYVDVWDHSGSWGYSLWSGCSEDDRFAMGTARAGDTSDISEHVAPLVDAVAEDLKTAHQTKCFERSC